MNPRPSLIMLVEDNPDHAELTKCCLEQQAPSSGVIHLTDGSEVIDYLLKRDIGAQALTNPLPDLVLLDLRLPKVGGMDALRAIRGSRELPRIPVVVLTSSDAANDLREAYTCGANAYTVKPIDYEQLQRLIGDICTFWLGWNRVPPVVTAEGIAYTPPLS